MVVTPHEICVKARSGAENCKKASDTTSRRAGDDEGGERS